jgi:hypothetical protein
MNNSEMQYALVNLVRNGRLATLKARTQKALLRELSTF